MAEKIEAKNASYQRPSWDEYFLKIMDMVGSRGSCDRGRAGCVITQNNRIAATGYAGSPSGLPHCDEVGHEMDTVVNEDGSQTRHCIRTVHAEQNAICEAARMGISINGATLYTKTIPCYTCAKMIINTGIKKIVCTQGSNANTRSQEALKEANIELVILNENIIK